MSEQQAWQRLYQAEGAPYGYTSEGLQRWVTEQHARMGRATVQGAAEGIVDRMASTGITESGLQRLGELETEANIRRWSQWSYKGYTFSHVDLEGGAVVWAKGVHQLAFSENALRHGEIGRADVERWIDQRGI